MGYSHWQRRPVASSCRPAPSSRLDRTVRWEWSPVLCQHGHQRERLGTSCCAVASIACPSISADYRTHVHARATFSSCQSCRPCVCPRCRQHSPFCPACAVRCTPTAAVRAHAPSCSLESTIRRSLRSSLLRKLSNWASYLGEASRLRAQCRPSAHIQRC